MKRHENTTYNEENKQSIDTDPELMQKLALAEDISYDSISCIQKVKQRHGRYIKTQIKLLKMKTMFRMRSTLDSINIILDIVEEKTDELEVIAKKLLKMKYTGKTNL